ncbi:translation initiation factor IF-3, mitochondrial [Orycteropus afer afer]|uniref:Translation initiation factor IF-3, mitochondrial n=1 Tax=Orycteropus afer afer TaxID=1230840 RepID=A0A8B7B7T1_ORYAF|nr:translation initiation factor IF-3, mitochondrial [Orycteropus afer afer]
MAAWFLKRLAALRALKTESSCITGRLGKELVQNTALGPSVTTSAPRLPCLIHTRAFSVAEDPQDARKKKKTTETAFTNTGRKISERIIHVIDEKGHDLGDMHRADVIKLMEQRELRLVKRSGSTEHPQYQLMTGLQIHEERMRIRERDKATAKTGRYTAVHSRDKATPGQEALFNQILQTMPGTATFSSKPQAVRGGKAVTCVLRHMSRKEESAYRDAQGARQGDVLNKGQDRPPDALHQ